MKLDIDQNDGFYIGVVICVQWRQKYTNAVDFDGWINIEDSWM